MVDNIVPSYEYQVTYNANRVRIRLFRTLDCTKVSWSFAVAAEWVLDQKRNLVLDMQRTDIISAKFCTFLISLHKKARTVGTGFGVVVSPQSDVGTVLQLVGLDRVLNLTFVTAAEETPCTQVEAIAA